MIPHQVPTYISWWLDPFSKVREAFQITWTDLKEYALSPFLLIGRVLNKVQKKKSTLLNNYPSLAYIIMVSTTVTTHCANTITSAKISEPFIRSKQRKASLDRNQSQSWRGQSHWNITCRRSFRRLCCSYHKMPEDQVQMLIRNKPGVSGIACILKGRLILLSVL